MKMFRPCVLRVGRNAYDVVKANITVQKEVAEANSSGTDEEVKNILVSMVHGCAKNLSVC